MTPASGSKRPRKGGPKRPAQPFIVEPVRGGIAVYRRPVGNLAIPRLCGVMPNRPKAVEFARLLARAESAAPDLFLEATDDGIEALEAVIAACLEAAHRGDARLARGDRGDRSERGERGARPGRAPRGARRPRETSASADDASATPPPAADGEGTGESPYAEGQDGRPRRNAGRRRGRRGRGGRPGGEDGGAAPPEGGDES